MLRGLRVAVSSDSLAAIGQRIKIVLKQQPPGNPFAPQRLKTNRRKNPHTPIETTRGSLPSVVSGQILNGVALDHEFQCGGLRVAWKPRLLAI